MAGPQGTAGKALLGSELAATVRHLLDNLTNLDLAVGVRTRTPCLEVEVELPLGTAGAELHWGHSGRGSGQG